MGRISKKENKTIYQMKREEFGYSREKVAELTNIEPFRIERIENDVEEFFYCCTSFIFSTFKYFIDPLIDSINTKTNSSAIRTNYSFNNHYVKKEK